VEARRARDDREVQAALELRERVFCGEQGVAPSADRDGRDPDALHVVATDDERLLGTCRLLIEDGVARLGRLAVEPGARRRGVAGAILAEAHALAAANGARTVRLHAQVDARALYEAAGYAATGGPFMEEGIPHLPMERPLA